jgi:hypothetical protein
MQCTKKYNFLYFLILVLPINNIHSSVYVCNRKVHEVNFAWQKALFGELNFMLPLPIISQK